MNLLSFHEQGGILIPIENGIPLCSLRANEEAAAWVQKQNISASHAVIIGLGAGHHVRAWLEANPGSRVTVVDSRPALIAPFRAGLHELAERVEIVIVETVEALLSHELMKQIANELPPVLFFQPAAGSHARFYLDLFRAGTGRSVAGLSYFMKHFGFSSDLELSDDGRFLTVKDLGVLIDAHQADHPKAPVVRVLRELLV